MANINITEKWLRDPRRIELIEKIGEIVTDGTAIKIWLLAFTYFSSKNKALIPEHLFDRIPNSELFLEVDLAERREDGVYIRGSEDEFRWYHEGIEQRSHAGKKSAQRPRDEFGRLKPNEYPTSIQRDPTRSNEIQPSSSSSSSSSLRKELNKFNSSQTASGRRSDQIYKNAKELREGLRIKLGEWFELYPDAKFLEKQLLVIFQYYADKHDRRPTTHGSWVKAVAYHLKTSWEVQKNLCARDRILETLAN